MFINEKKKGKFLILMMDGTKAHGKDNFRAFVKEVEMKQSGPFCSGIVEINGVEMVLSGDYGGAGFPVVVPRKVFNCGVCVPESLYNAWKEGGHWGGFAGREKDEMMRWVKGLK